jgi:hypothetical protein
MGVPRAVFFEFDPFELTRTQVPDQNIDEALSEIADYVKTEILQYVGSGASPVSGGPWKKTLSPEYKKIKEKISGQAIANLELTGDMLDALEAKVVDGKIQVGIWDGSQVPKAYNHNVGDTLPQRQFIPEDGQKFKSPIMEGMKEIAESFLEE